MVVVRTVLAEVLLVAGVVAIGATWLVDGVMVVAGPMGVAAILLGVLVAPSSSVIGGKDAKE